jgi:hypothetical protein
MTISCASDLLSIMDPPPKTKDCFNRQPREEMSEFRDAPNSRFQPRSLSSSSN